MVCIKAGIYISITTNKCLTGCEFEKTAGNVVAVCTGCSRMREKEAEVDV